MPFIHPDRLHDTFAAAFAAGDVEELVDLYEPTAVQVGRDGDIATGQMAIRAAFEHLLTAGVTLSGRQVMSLIVGDVVLTSSEYEVPASNGDPTASRTVRTAEVSRRQADGTWRIVVDVPAFS